jgi:hypothetical protein
VTLASQTHEVAPEALAPALIEFFSTSPPAGSPPPELIDDEGDRRDLRVVDSGCLWRRPSFSRPREAAIGDRHRYDVDELAGIAEHRHAQQRAPRVVVAEVIADDLTGRDQVGTGARGDVHGPLGHVSQPGTRGAKRHGELAITC